MLEAVVSAAYGPPGSGKSADAAALGAGGFFFLAPPGGLRVARTVLGVDLAPFDAKTGAGQLAAIRTLEEARAWLPWIKSRGFLGVVVDDASVITHQSMFNARRDFAYWKETPITDAYAEDGTVKVNVVIDAKTGKAFKVSGYDRELWSYQEQLVRGFTDAARHLGLHVHITGHEQPAFADKGGTMQKGGLDVAWKKLTPQLAFICDLIVRAESSTTKDWDTRCACDPADPFFAMKNRFGNLPISGAPLNTAETLREVGYTIPRPRGLEWIEDCAEKIAQVIQAGKPEAQAIIEIGAHLRAQNVAFPFAQWAVRDGVHRARLRAHRLNAWGRL